MFTSWRNPVTRPLEEKYLGNDIENILEKALTDDNSGSLAFSKSKQSGSRKRENPAKPSLERYGIEFPRSKHVCSSSSDGAISSQILYKEVRGTGRAVSNGHLGKPVGSVYKRK